jgi:hypothetical protein
MFQVVLLLTGCNVSDTDIFLDAEEDSVDIYYAIKINQRGWCKR